jgi:hypothetical protein
MAKAHTDAGHSHLGARLVYGGHTISTCFAQLTRAMPRMAMLLSWERCDHLAPAEAYRLTAGRIERRTTSPRAVTATCFQ